MTSSDTQVPASAYPLAWPDGWERTPAHRRSHSQFGDRRYGHKRENLDAWARDHLIHQIRLLGGRQMVLSTNIELRRDGLPYANRRTPDDVGVAVYWQQRVSNSWEWRVVACDRWVRLWENMRAIGLTLEALRGLERWGASGVLERAFQGFAALPSATDELATQHWRVVLGVPGERATLADVEIVYRNLAREHHPDRGGDPRRMAAINEAIRQARTELGA